MQAHNTSFLTSCNSLRKSGLIKMLYSVSWKFEQTGTDKNAIVCFMKIWTNLNQHLTFKTNFLDKWRQSIKLVLKVRPRDSNPWPKTVVWCMTNFTRTARFKKRHISKPWFEQPQKSDLSIFLHKTCTTYYSYCLVKVPSETECTTPILFTT